MILNISLLSAIVFAGYFLIVKFFLLSIATHLGNKPEGSTAHTFGAAIGALL